MTPKQMQENSAKKVQQLLDLMKVLHIRVEAKDKIDMKTGFIEKTIYWIDEEQYPAEAAKEAVPAAPEPATPSNEKDPA